MPCKDKGDVSTVRDFFSTPARPVGNSELLALKSAGVKELAALVRAQCGS